MTVDREQTRRESSREQATRIARHTVEQWSRIDTGSTVVLSRVLPLARDYLALLAELEQAERDSDERADELATELAEERTRCKQAERERDEAKHQRDNFERIARERAVDADRAIRRLNEAEARLVKADTLAEAAKALNNGTYGSERNWQRLTEALAAYEQEQKPPKRTPPHMRDDVTDWLESLPAEQEQKS